MVTIILAILVVAVIASHQHESAWCRVFPFTRLFQQLVQYPKYGSRYVRAS